MKITLNKKIIEGIRERKEDISLDDFDLRILEMLSADSRAGYAELAEKIELSRDGIKYRIKKLIEKGFIKGFDISINPVLFGLKNHKVVMISLLNFDKRFVSEMAGYIENCEFVVSCRRTIGQYDFILDIVSRDDNHLSSIINSIKSRFQSGIKEIQILGITENG